MTWGYWGIGVRTGAVVPGSSIFRGIDLTDAPSHISDRLHAAIDGAADPHLHNDLLTHLDDTGYAGWWTDDPDNAKRYASGHDGENTLRGVLGTDWNGEGQDYDYTDDEIGDNDIPLRDEPPRPHTVWVSRPGSQWVNISHHAAHRTGAREPHNLLDDHYFPGYTYGSGFDGEIDDDDADQADIESAWVVGEGMDRRKPHIQRGVHEGPAHPDAPLTDTERWLQNMGHRATHFIHQSPPTEHPLYRGMTVPDSFLQQARDTGKLTLPLSSFDLDASTAACYSTPDPYRGYSPRTGNSVMLRMAPGGKALPLIDGSEHLTHGDFDVTGLRPITDEDREEFGGHGDDNTMVMDIRQRSVPAPVQPRTAHRTAASWSSSLDDDGLEMLDHPSGLKAFTFPGVSGDHHWHVMSPSGNGVAKGKSPTLQKAQSAAFQVMENPPRPYRYEPDDLEFGLYPGEAFGGGAAGVWSKGDFHGPDNWLSGITWGSNGEIGHVETKPDHQRRGLATQLFDYVKQHHRPDLRHSPTLSDDGRAWSQYEQSRHAHRTAMPYYHYTDQEFEPGDELKPAIETDPSLSKSKWKGEPGDYADYDPSKVYFTWRDTDPGNDKYMDSNSVFGPYAYEVEPVGEIEDDPEKEIHRRYHEEELGIPYGPIDLGYNDYMAPNAIVKRKIDAPQVAKDYAEQMRGKYGPEWPNHKKARIMSAAVTVYTQPNCVQCTMTKKQLDKLGIEHDTVDVTQDPDAHAYVTGLGYTAAPVVVVNDGEDSWAGFRPERLKALSGE